MSRLQLAEMVFHLRMASVADITDDDGMAIEELELTPKLA